MSTYYESIHRGSSPGAGFQIALAGGVSAALLIAIVIAAVRPEVAVAAGGLIGAVLLLWLLRCFAAHPMWLAFPLMLVELLTAGWFLNGSARAIFHYGLIALLCLPLLPGAWRNRTFRKDGFGLYVILFGWAAVSISYSLAPAFSAGRLICAVLVFVAVSCVTWQITDPEQVPAMLKPLMLACGVVVALVAFSAIAMPRSFTWIVPDDTMAESAGDVVRFCGIFSGPNDVGEMMLVTVGVGAVLWRQVRGKWRLMLAAVMLMALGAAALADSRTPFVALLIGGACYLVWRYRGRAIFVLLFAALLAMAANSRLGGEEYLSRGNVSTLTGRTDVWEFAISQIKERPLLGYGYEVSGAILQSRYFPVWWGPWDEGPHSSLHDGYIDRAVGLGLPALLLWLFIVLRPWFALFRRREDRWGLKPVFFWMVIPMLVHNVAEVSISDFTGMVGLSFFLVWAIAERVRVIERQRERLEQIKQHSSLSPAAAALTASLALLMLAATARAQSTYHFPTLPPHAKLPSGAACAAAASTGNAWEPRPDNYAANHTMPTFVELIGFHLAPIKGNFAPISDFARVDGRFTGTTDQILRWGACKWGIDEDVVRAQAVVESHWHQDDVGDASHDWSSCPPGRGFPGAWDGSTCQQSYGIMQVKFSSFGGWPLPKNSTAFNVDFRLAYQRACMNGDINYLAQQTPDGDHPRYPYGNVDQMLWGCMGDWYSGNWYDAGAIRYVAEVKEALAGRKWERSGF